MLDNFFREVVIDGMSEGEIQTVNALLEATPIIANMPAFPSSNGLTHVFEEIKAIDTLTKVDQDAPITEMKFSSDLAEQVLGTYSGKIEVGEDKLRRMGQTPDQYFNKRLPQHWQLSLMGLETGLFNNLRQFCIDNGKAVSAGATSGDTYDIFAVTYNMDEIGLLYDPNGYGDGRLMDVEKLSGGDLIELSDGSTGYKTRAKFDLGFLTANKKYVGAIVNINDANMPTELMIDDMLTDANEMQGATVLYMDAKMLNKLRKFKGSALQMNVQDTTFNRIIEVWNKTPIITSKNIGTHTAVTL